MACADGDESNLQASFDVAFQLFNEMGKKFESSSGDSFQNEAKKIIKMLEDLTRTISVLGTFSSNEDIEEVSNNDIRFFLLPALLGSLTVQLMSEDRLNNLHIAEIYFKDFLQRCNDYGISKVDPAYLKSKSVDTELSEAVPDLIAMTKQRDRKIRRYKELKEMESKLEEYKTIVDSKTADEEVQRKYFLTLVRWWIGQSIDDLDNIQKEQILLEKFAGETSAPSRSQKSSSTPVLKPIIITKNEIQKKVYGLGYPSIPTMTVDEFYEQKVSDGTFTVPDMSLQTAGYDRRAIAERDAIDKEQELEADDPMALKTAREWDDWKDEHRRGWGNRKNKG